MNTIASFFSRLRNRHFFILDSIAFLTIPTIALFIRLDGNVDFSDFGYGLFTITIIFAFLKLSLFYFSGMYQRYWRYASVDELAFIGVLIGMVLVLQTITFIILYQVKFLPISDLPRSIPVLDGILSFVVVGGIRFSVRISERAKERAARYGGVRALIVGAGKAGVSLVSEMQRNPEQGYIPVGLIDDDRRKSRLQIRGIAIEGNKYKIPEAVKRLRVDKVIIAMPSAAGKDIREVHDLCRMAGVPVSTLPSIFEIINGQVKLESIRDVSIDDLLRRNPIKTNINKVADFINGKRVLVTGAGGSIGSEICRQILPFSPSKIALLGHGENTIFDIQQELLTMVRLYHKNGGNGHRVPDIHAFIADIRSESRLKIIFEKFRPDIIFHAAAHKHVPMMEENIAEAVSNNIYGTRNLLFLSSRYNVNHFVNLSTDKAVNPTSMMGVSKRLSELLVMQAAKRTGKKYVCVRFGNVLGSNGSVIPTFQRQIQRGGPVTITHPGVKRYFMTIPESVQLVLQSSVIGRGGEIFVLDMGEPIKIEDLAKDLIKLSGFEYNKDIKIKYTGLRPGEKLFEELFISGEEYAPTEHEKILIACNASQIVPDTLDEHIETLFGAAKRNNETAVKEILHHIVPEYKPFDGSGSKSDNGSDGEFTSGEKSAEKKR